MQLGDFVTTAMQVDSGKPSPALVIQSDSFNQAHGLGITSGAGSTEHWHPPARPAFFTPQKPCPNPCGRGLQTTAKTFAPAKANDVTSRRLW